MSENGVFKDIMFGTVGYIFGRREGRKNALGARLAPPFKTKIVITMPSWSIPLVAVATGAALYFKFSYIVNAIELLIVCGAFLFTWEMSRMVTRMRYRMHHMLNGIDEDAEDDGRFGEWMDEPAELTTQTKPAMRKVNGDNSTRV